MPGPVTHIILADKVFDRHFPGKNRRQFYLGTLFPDIRYLGVIARNQTHPKVNGMEEIAGLDDFQAGIAFHALCDQINREYMVAHQAAGAETTNLYSGFLLKLAVDMHAYPYRSNWQPIAGYLDHLPEEAAAFGVSRSHMAAWHRLLKQYLGRPPDPELMINLARQAGIQPAAGSQSMPTLDEIRNNQAVATLVAAFFEQFDALINEYSV